MSLESGGMQRSTLDVVFFVLCFIAVVLIAAGIISGTVWLTVFAFLLGFVGLGHFLISGWL
jgi:hypothetical protein